MTFLLHLQSSCFFFLLVFTARKAKAEKATSSSLLGTRTLTRRPRFVQSHFPCSVCVLVCVCVSMCVFCVGVFCVCVFWVCVFVCVFCVSVIICVCAYLLVYTVQWKIYLCEQTMRDPCSNPLPTPLRCLLSLPRQSSHATVHSPENFSRSSRSSRTLSTFVFPLCLSSLSLSLSFSKPNFFQKKCWSPSLL